MVIPGNVLLYHRLAFLQRIALLPTTLCFLEITSDSCNLVLRLRGRYGTYSNLTYLIPSFLNSYILYLSFAYLIRLSPQISAIFLLLPHVTQLSEQETKELSRYQRAVVRLNPDLRLPTKSARSDGSSHLLGQAPSTAFPVAFSPFPRFCLQSSG